MPQYYLDSPNFATATAVYANATLTVLAPDGYYSSNGIVRSQVGGQLSAYAECESCKEYQKPVEGELLLDLYPGAAAAYSLRLLDSTYTGALIRVRRASDNAEQDIGFDANGDLDTAALATFCAGTDGFVVRWYDQSSNGNDAVQATTSAQPQIVASGSVITDNGKPATQFDGVNDSLTGPSGLDYSTMFAASVYSGATLNSHIIGAQSSNTDGWRFHARADARFRVAETNIDITGASNETGYFLQVGAIVSGTASNYLNSTNSASSSASIGSTTSLSLTIGTGVLRFQGKMHEVLVYVSDQSANRTGIESNINQAYNIYWDGTVTALLDDYQGAAAAYSLRALNSFYTGPLVRVRRASDNAEQDIKALYSGDLNTSALATFCAGTDGFAVRWYDQSGNGNDAVQGTTSTQPKIYDSTTGVVVDSQGKPRLDLTGAGNMVVGNLSLSQAQVFVVFEKTQLGYYGGLQTVATNEIWGLNGAIYSSFFSPARDIVTANNTLSINTPYLMSMQHDGTVIFRLNTSEVMNTTRTFTNATNIQLRSFSYIFSGYYQELVIYSSVNSLPDTTGIESNINDYFNIY